MPFAFQQELPVWLEPATRSDQLSNGLIKPSAVGRVGINQIEGLLALALQPTLHWRHL